MSMNAMSSTVKTMNSSSTAQVVRPKKVEVRWLESESELYLKQWQHRYHQLVGLDNSYLKKNGRQLGSDSISDPFDDWCLSSKSLLDLDIDFDLNYPKNNNIIISNSSVDDNSGSPVQSTAKTTIAAFDHIFWSTDDKTVNQKIPKTKKNKRLKPAFDDNNSLSLSRGSSAVEEEDLVLTVDGYIIRQQRNKTNNDTNEEDDEESAEDSFENIRIQPIKRVVQKNKSSVNDSNKNEVVLSEKERQFSIDLNKRLELLAKDQALTEKINETVKANKPKPRARDRTRPARPRPPPIRRQIFKCEHIGCSYQSDRNFNFLRHKRTHRKNKPEDEPTLANNAVSVNVPSVQPTATVLADISSVKSTQTLVIINNNQISNQNSSQTLKLIGNANNCSSTDQPVITSIGAGDTISIASVVTPEELQAIKTSIDCLLKSCDTTDDNLKISINNSNGITGSCNENHSYHQKVLFV